METTALAEDGRDVREKFLRIQIGVHQAMHVQYTPTRRNVIMFVRGDEAGEIVLGGVHLSEKV